jgi:CheY-like chemotaxis protein
MSRSILWLDNDPGQIHAIIKALEKNGDVVTVCRNVSAAEHMIDTAKFDLVVLDVMIPITADELAAYPYAETDNTLSTGLLFYRRVRERLLASGTPAMVVTVRIDNEIVQAFVRAGLPANRFVTRYSVRNTKTLLTRLDEVAGSVGTATGEPR